MKNLLPIFIALFLPFIVFSQNHYTISGYIKDKTSGETLIGASVYETGDYTGTTSNEYGFYSFSLPEGKYAIKYTHLGYEEVSFEVDLSQNMEKTLELVESGTTLQQVVVKADYKSKPTQGNVFNVVKLSIKEIQQIPSMFGEADLIKALQTLSGVKTIGDGSSGMFVRGGSSDQNLILIDEAPIYNPSHLFGLISIFNPDALNQVSFYKSNIPAQYGGRASAVIDCKMKEGSTKKYGFSIGLSPFSSIVSVDGPIVKEESAFFVSMRKSLVDLFIKPSTTTPLVPAFYDINAKVNRQIGLENRIFFSFYTGKDRLESADGFLNTWGNTSGTFRWNRTINPKLFSNVSLIYSNYTNKLAFETKDKKYEWATGLQDVNAKIDLTYYHNPNNVLKMGLGSIYHQFIPGETNDTEQSIPRINAFEHAFYVLNDIKPTTWLGFNYGLRLSIFQNVGEATWYNYDENYLPTMEQTNEKGSYNVYAYLEPRASANVRLTSKASLKLAYARNVQYMQILQNSSLSYSSLETWFPANPNTKPIIADIISLGWFQNLNETYTFSIESYYKTYKNQIDYVDHAKLLNNPFIEGEIRNGTATAYGLELLFKKETGRLTGSISYAYSRALRTVIGVNQGETYNSPYDIPHDFRLSANYALSQKWSFAALWMYTTGRPVTLPVGFFYEEKEPIPIYSARNASRFPGYARLDVGLTYTTKPNPKKAYWTITAGAYNVLGRKNPLGYDFVGKASGEIEVFQYTLFTILPSFSIKYNY